MKKHGQCIFVLDGLWFSYKGKTYIPKVRHKTAVDGGCVETEPAEAELILVEIDEEGEEK